MSEVLVWRNTEGDLVAEVDLNETTLTVTEILDQAREHRADLVWAYGGSPAADGFVPRPGYTRLRSESPVAGEPLPRMNATDYGPVLARAYLGQWGHRWVDSGQPLPADGSVVLCLHEGDAPIGICRVWPDQRLVDQPGVVPERRGVEPCVRLLRAACELLGSGPVEVDTWGESPEVLRAYAALGFAVVEELQGWELRLS
jgi:hypothetical protein